MLEGRKRFSFVAACGAFVLGSSLLVTSPTMADEEIEQAKAKADRLYHQAEQASERYNDANVELGKSQDRVKSLRADLDRQAEALEVVRKRVASTIVTQSQGQSLSSTSQVLLAEDTDAFIEQMTTVAAFNDQQAGLMQRFATELKQLELREAAAEREMKEIARLEAKLAEEKAEIDRLASQAQEIVEDLEAEAAAEAAARAAAREPRVTRAAERPEAPVAAPSASGRAGAAVSYALAQVGDAYVYGATGDDAFDCSGLTMRAWGAAGVSLPHSSSAQMGMGSPVSSSALQPGDLVFYYSPVSHVGIYIGNGQIAHAANPSSGVEVAPVFSMPFSGARRVG